MFAQLYILFVIFFLLFIVFRHVYLLRFKLMKILKNKHMLEWNKMMGDTGWLAPNWSSLYRTKAFYNFVWYSNEDYGDHDLSVLRKKLKRINVELIIAFVIVIAVTILLINFKILR